MLFRSARIKFDYEVLNAEGTVITTAATTLVFIDKKTGKPCQAPADILAAFGRYFNS